MVEIAKWLVPILCRGPGLGFSDFPSDMVSTKLELATMDLSSSDSMTLLCQSVCMLDHFLVIVSMYYMASLFVYLFCRKPNPDIPTSSEMTLRVGCTDTH